MSNILTGSISSDSGVVNGTETNEQQLMGNVASENEIMGTISPQEQLVGEISQPNQLEGSVSQEQKLEGDVAVNPTGTPTKGVSKYPELEEKPTINDVELIGNKTAEDLGLQPKGNYLTEVPEGYVKDEELKKYALKEELPEIPKKVSAFENDKGYLTEHQSLEGYATEGWVEKKGFLTEHQDLSGYAKKAEIPTVPEWAMKGTKPTYTPEEIGADIVGSASQALSEANTFTGLEIGKHNVATDSHNDIRIFIEKLTVRVNALADSDDTTLDQMSEIVAYIKNNRELVEQVTTEKVSVTDIIDNLTTNLSNKALSASMGVYLKQLIDAIVIPIKVSAFENDKGYLTDHQDISGKLDKSDLLNLVYPVGSIYMTSTNTAPAIGGTWELVGKGFKDAQGSGTGFFEKNTTNTSSCTVYYRRSGNTMFLKFALKTLVAAAETNLTFGTLDLAALGVVNISTHAYTSVPFGGENGIILCSLSTAGKLTHTDVVIKGNGTSVAAESTVYGQYTLVLKAADMLDSFCDKFYWKRTA